VRGGTPRPRVMSHRMGLASVATLMIVATTFLWITPASAVIAGTGIAHAAPSVVHRIEAADPSRGHSGTQGARHKEGPIAVVASVAGVIVIVVFIVGLGSLSVRRRTRDAPPEQNRGWPWPPGRGGGFR
jgi:hypothetical protein